MTTTGILPQPASTYQLLLDAARTWPDSVATQWIPDPGDYTRCLAWTYADLAGTVTQIANALTALGVRRPDAVTLSAPNTSMLYATTLAAQAAGIAAPVNPTLSDDHLAGLIRRAQSRVVVTAGPELNEQLWRRMLAVARRAGATAVLALRPDGARGDPPVLPTDGLADSDLTVAYLDEVIAGQQSGHLAGDLPQPGDLAAFVHTGGTTGAPRIAAHTHANQLACGRGIAEAAGLAAGEAALGGLPLFHVNALIVTGAAPMFAGLRVVWPGPAGYRDRRSGEVPVAYVVPADPARFDEAELLAWSGTAIGEPAARPKRIYPIEAIPVTAIGKHYKPALATDAAARAAADVLAGAGLPGAQVTAAYENGRPSSP